MPNIQMDTDHRPVMLETRTMNHKRPRNKAHIPDGINWKKLQEEPICRAIEDHMNNMYQKLDKNDDSTEEEWQLFKATLTDIIKTECGTRRSGKGQRKGTAWWNDTVKQAVKEKKKLFKKWSTTKQDEDYEMYRLARKECKRTVKEAKDLSWRQFGEDLADKCEQSSRAFYKLVKTYRTREEPFDPTSIINDRNGNPLSDKEEVNIRWKEYFEELLNPTSNDSTHKRQEHFKPRFHDHVEPAILLSEVRWAINISPKGKAAGIDGLTTEAIQACGETGVKWLTRIFNKAWTERAVPLDWQNSIIIPIWKKKGSKRDCGKYRGISLLSHIGKMYAKILEKRIRPIADPQLCQAQFGFRKNRGCTDAIFALRQMCEKAIEFNQELHMVFVDQEKAFDRVNREKLWTVLEEYGIKGQLLDNTRALYRESRAAVRTRSGYTTWFDVTSGVRQGCVLSPLLFIIYMDRITREANPAPEESNELLFADDQALIHSNADKLQSHTDRLNAACERYDMKISVSKTESMVVSRSQGVDCEILVNNSKLKQVREFKYLGSLFTDDGKIAREIETRCQKANNVTYQLGPLLTHPVIPMETKRRLINAIFVPTLCYQSQTWALNKKAERKITTCEMKCLRRAANKTRLEKVRNEAIRDIVGTKPILQFISAQRLKWFGHLMRMEPNQPASRSYNSRLTGTRPRGRPRKRWMDGIREDLRNQDLTTAEATHLARDRKLHFPTTLHGNSGGVK